jgi:hypothetical protein
MLAYNRHEVTNYANECITANFGSLRFDTELSLRNFEKLPQSILIPILVEIAVVNSFLCVAQPKLTVCLLMAVATALRVLIGGCLAH